MEKKWKKNLNFFLLGHSNTIYHHLRLENYLISIPKNFIQERLRALPESFS